MSGDFNVAKYSGKHLILDLFDVESNLLCDVNDIRNCLREAAKNANATILSDDFHHFGEGFGVTGLIVLAESHISIHTWPEENYAAIDIFMCGECDPRHSIESIYNYFKPKRKLKNLIYRGIN